ncbi:MAG: cadmium-translocating P-type ATPase [Spirochaetales bacterium]|nr:cadmium-translocating P-type ATPase [Spirochaetales bacterium]
MATKIEMKKYRLEGLDCAQCANEIETTLRKIEGFQGSVVSFGTATLLIPADSLKTAAEIVKKIEPGARILEKESPKKETEEPNLWHLGRIGLATLLTLLGVIFHDTLHETPFRIAEYSIFILAYILVGGPVVLAAVKNIFRGRVFDEMFLMTIATLGAFAIHELAEAVAVMLFYSLGEYVQNRAVGKSRRSISELMDLRPEMARRMTDEGPEEVAPEAVEVGSIIEVRPGERVPLDGTLVTGRSSVNTAALTGESAPRSVEVGDTVLSGFVNESGTIRVHVTKPFAESSVARILELVEDAASRKAPTEKFISRFASIYTPIIVGIATAVAFLPPLFIPDARLSEWVYRALVILVISCPCALVISVPLGYFGGIGGASRKGILIKGANFIDALRDVSTVVVDKTGTLTKGVFRVVQVVPQRGFETDQLLYYAAYAEAHSTHPVARTIRESYGKTIDLSTLDEVREERGFGVWARVGERSVAVGGVRLLEKEGITLTYDTLVPEGTVVYVVVDGILAGHIKVADEVKEGAAQAIADLRSLGVQHIIMLTGDNENVARQVVEQVGLDQCFAGLLPEQKVEKVEELTAGLEKGKKLAFVGDGINDAPVLMRADVGFAMGALGSEAAIEAADVVLMDDKIQGIGSAIRVARFTRSVVVQNILLALLVKAGFLSLGAFGLATMWEAVIADVGVSLLAVLNSTRTLHFLNRNPA